METNYGAVSRFNHWVVAIAIIAMLAVGLLLSYDFFSKEEAGWFRDIHKSVGVLLLAFVVWRVLWRIIKGFPAPSADMVMPKWQHLASKLTHYALLIGMILMPVSGVIGSIFRGRPIDVFGLFSIPAQTKNEMIAGLGGGVHYYLGHAIAVLVVIHVAAALKHHFVDKDSTLVRMTSGRTLS